MFIPVGILLALLLPPRRWWVAVLIGFGMTVTIETAQLFIPGRFSDLRDIVANTAGAAIGVAVAVAAVDPGRREPGNRTPALWFS